MIDFKIKDAFKEFNTPEKESEFLKNFLYIYEKYDGVKITLVRNSEPYNSSIYQKNWIVSYKGSILNSSDFGGIRDFELVRDESIGCSQFVFIHQHLKLFHRMAKDVIPQNTELFVEFIMNKPTITRDYVISHEMILLAASPCYYKESFGKLETTQTGDLVDENTLFLYGDALNIKPPSLLALGVMEKYSFNVIKERIKLTNSQFGGKIEGVVIKTEDGEMYKIVQDDQYDKDTRLKKKNRYRMNSFDEWCYWLWVHEQAKLVQHHNKQHISRALWHVSHDVYDAEREYYHHDKKTHLQMMDDIFLTAKIKTIKETEGNNGAMFIGRFQPVTQAHVNIVEEALKIYDTVTVNIVSGKTSEENPLPLKLIKEMWERVSDKIKIQTTRTGNLITAINKAEDNINVVLAGSDRVKSYLRQLKGNPDIEVVEIDRDESEISATKARKAIAQRDFEAMNMNMDKRHYVMYTTLKLYIPHELKFHLYPTVSCYE